MTADTTLRADTLQHHPIAPTSDTLPHAMEMVTGPFGIGMEREGSGTSWLPDDTPMYAFHAMRGRWWWMLHGSAFGQYIDEGSDRGDEQIGSVNWLMAMAKANVLGGHLTARGMFSTEASTVGRCGYPDLLASGETCRGAPLHDRQHPHDFFMELAASYERALTGRFGLQVYGGLVGEPALGPVAYPHRISALSNLMATIGHHWQDATHISFGVLSAGVYTRTWKLESSLFNGREPDENRYDLDLDRLDSYSARFWFLPTRHLAFQISAGRLKDTEGGGVEPFSDMTRTTASATYHRSGANSTMWATTALWGRNDERNAATNSFLLETDLNLVERHSFFARAEVVEKTGHDLALEQSQLPPCVACNVIPGPDLDEEVFTVTQLTGGYVHRFRPFSDLSLGVGLRAAVSFLPRDLKPFYGSRAPTGLALFVNLRPTASRMH